LANSSRQRPGFTLLLLPALLVTAAFALVACGGGGSEPSDEDYVKSVCNAGKKFGEDVQELIAEADPQDEEALADEFNDLLRNFVRDIRDANPPEDAEEGHNSLVASLEAAVAAVDEQGIEALFNFEEPEIALPADVSARLSAVAEDTPECVEAGDLF
jgi:hypothetical protein